MNTIVKRLYEGLFLVDSGEAASDWKGVNQTIEKILDKAGGEVVSIKKWDERRLAYEISGKSRGTYILAYFHCDPTNIAAIERAVQLNEQIMRVLILRTDRMSRSLYTPLHITHSAPLRRSKKSAISAAISGRPMAPT